MKIPFVIEQPFFPIIEKSDVPSNQFKVKLELYRVAPVSEIWKHIMRIFQKKLLVSQTINLAKIRSRTSCLESTLIKCSKIWNKGKAMLLKIWVYRLNQSNWSGSRFVISCPRKIGDPLPDEIKSVRFRTTAFWSFLVGNIPLGITLLNKARYRRTTSSLFTFENKRL